MRIFLKALVSGFILWATMFTFVSIVLDFYNKYELMKIIISISSGIVAVLFAYYLKIEKIKQAIVYSTVWLTVGLLLDYSVTMRFNNQIFSSMYLWLGYGLMFISPYLHASLIKKKSIWKK